MVCLLRVLTQLLLRGPVRARLTLLSCGQHSPVLIICSHLPQSRGGSYSCPFSRGFLFQRRCKRVPQKYQKKPPSFLFITQSWHPVTELTCPWLLFPPSTLISTLARYPLHYSLLNILYNTLIYMYRSYIPCVYIYMCIYIKVYVCILSIYVSIHIYLPTGEKIV